MAVFAGAYLYWERSDFDAPGLRYFSQPVSLAPFHLRDQFNNEFGVDKLKGYWSFLFFGYTHCPDICPTAMHDMANVYKELEKTGNAGDIKVVFVSVDPMRDTLTVLKDFVGYFNPLFLGVTGTKPEIDKLTEHVGAIYDFEDIETGSPIRDVNELRDHPGYLVNHYSSFIVINPDAKMVAHIYPPHHVDRVVNIINLIRNK